MGGQTTTTQNSSQQSQTQPWIAAQPQLQGLLANLGNVSTGVSPQQAAAASALTGAAASVPSFAPQATGLADTLLAGGGANTYAPMLSGAYTNLQSSLAPYLAPGYTAPMSTPGLSDALAAVNRNVTNQVNDQFAAAGRDLSPANTQALATGLAQGEAPLPTNQYNANVATQLGAINALYGAGNTTAGALSGLNQQGLSNALQGTSLGAQIPALATAPASAMLSAANTAQNLPLANLGAYESLLTPLASLGSQTSGTSQGTTTQSVPLAQQIAGGAIGGLGLLGALGGGGLFSGGLLGGLANLGGTVPSLASLPGGGSGLPWNLTWQNGQWTPTV